MTVNIQDDLWWYTTFNVLIVIYLFNGLLEKIFNRYIKFMISWLALHRMRLKFKKVNFKQQVPLGFFFCFLFLFLILLKYN